MAYQTSKNTVSRVIGNELIVIQLDTGRYHYFTQSTEELLAYFKEGATLESYISNESIDDGEKKKLEELCAQLLERKILETSQRLAQKVRTSKRKFNSPRFLRDGEKTIDQISFLSP